MIKCKVVRTTYEYGYGDCILYRIYCSCGKECGGWTTKKAEEDYQKHLEGMKNG